MSVRMARFDEETSRQLEAAYLTADAARRRAAVKAALALAPGERVIDIGTGPGFLAYELSDDVGPTGEVLAIDNSDAMVELARRRCAERSQVTIENGDAMRLPAADGELDAAVSVQVYEYLPNVEPALAEMHRVLRPGGRGAIVSTDWTTLAWQCSNQDLMARVVAAFADHCPHQALPRVLAPKLRQAGFDVVDRQVLPQFNPTYEPACMSARLVPVIARYVTGRHGLTANDVAAWRESLTEAAESDAYFFCLNQYLFVVTKPTR
jgi:arsenite methyltransferase